MLAEHASFLPHLRKWAHTLMFPMHGSRKIGVYIDRLCQQPLYAYSISALSAQQASAAARVTLKLILVCKRH